jgi:LacI family transcriptional regulator
MMALGVIRAGAEAGLTIPDDLSIVGFDDIQLAEHIHPPLTTLAQDKAGLGVAAARALLRQIEGADTAEPVTLPVSLIVRGSTAAAPAGR